MILGLTGGSGTGKSTACQYFENKGYIIADSDKIYRELCQKGEKCLEEIIENFGSGVADKEGNLIRSALGDIVFKDREKLELLNRITHKYIITRNKEIIEQNPHRHIVLDAPLLFEARLEDICTKTLCILASKEKRIERIMLRDGITREKALKRIDSQPEDDFYISRCDYAIYNDSDVCELTKNLESIFGGNNEV